MWSFLPLRRVEICPFCFRDRVMSWRVMRSPTLTKTPNHGTRPISKLYFRRWGSYSQSSLMKDSTVRCYMESSVSDTSVRPIRSSKLHDRINRPGDDDVQGHANNCDWPRVIGAIHVTHCNWDLTHTMLYPYLYCGGEYIPKSSSMRKWRYRPTTSRSA